MPRSLDGHKRRRPKQSKRFMNIGIWNVKSMRGKAEDIAKGLTELKIDIAVISETKKKGNGAEQIENYIHIYSGVPKEQRAKSGVSLMILKTLKKYITNWEAINERIIKLNMSYLGHRLTIIGVYAPNEDENAEVKDQYIEDLNETLREVGNMREIILIGDMNARTGKRIKHQIVGSHGEETHNNNGQRLIDICEQHELRIMNGYFNHKDIHKYTWREIARNRKSIIDYLIVRQQTNMEILDVRAYRGPDCGSDHYLVKSKIFLPFVNTSKELRKHTDITQITHKKYKLDLLKDESIRLLYQARLDQKLNEETESLNPSKIYEHIKTALHQTAAEALGEEERTVKRQNFWWNDELNSLRNERQKLHQKWLQTKQTDDHIAYKRARAKFKKKIIEEKNKQWERKCQELENYIGGRRTTESWRFIKNLRKQTNNKINLEIITEEKWKKHFENMLTEQRYEFQQIPEEVNIQVEGEEIEIEYNILKSAINSLKNGRAAGPGGIAPELIKYGSDKLHRMIKRLFDKCLIGEIIPSEWKESWITPLHKTGPRNQCENYRGLSVTSTFSRLYGRTIAKLITNDYQLYQTEEQSGFRAGRSTIDNIFCLTQIIEKRMATARETHLVFVDLTKAYDNVPIKNLFKILEESPINATIIKTIKEMYRDTHARVKVGTKLTSNFKVTKGLRQGCCMSPILFNIYLDAALKQWRRKCEGMGIPIGDRTLYTLHYADDQVVIAQDYDDAEYMMRKLSEEYSKWGLTINLNKTEYMCVGGMNQDIRLDDGTLIKGCDNYTYLGTKMEKTGKSEEMISSRINNARKITGTLNSILWQKDITPKTKMHIYDAIMKSTLTSGCEVWQISRNMERKLLTTEMDFLRRSARVSRTEHVRNEEVRRRVKRETTIMEEIRRKQLIWYGHVNRMSEDRLPKKVMEWIPRERKRRGRPRETWKKGIKRAMSERNLHDGDWEDRSQWKLGSGRRPQSL